MLTIILFLLGFPPRAGNWSPCLMCARPPWPSISFQLCLDTQSEFINVFLLLCPQRAHGPHCLLGGLLHDSFHAPSLSFIPVIPASVISLVLETTFCRMAMCLGFPPASGGSFGFMWLLMCSFDVLFCFSCISGKILVMKLFYSFQTVFWNGMMYTCIMYHKKTTKNPLEPQMVFFNHLKKLVDLLG